VARLSVCRVVDVKAYSHQGLPLTYELSTDTGLPSTEFAIDPRTGVVDLLRPLDYERDPHQYHLKVKVVENGRPVRSSMVNVCISSSGLHLYFVLLVKSIITSNFITLLCTTYVLGLHY